METTGKIISVAKDIVTGKLNITLQIDTIPSDDIRQLTKKDEKGNLPLLNIIVKLFKKKRSLDANGYLWVLCTKIAEVVESSKDEIYEEMLQKYGYLYKDDNGYVPITIKADDDISRVDGHWKFYKSNGKFASYLKIKGTSEYDTAEMAKFIDMVVLEAKELGIETMTPTELNRMLSVWGKE